MSENSKIEWTDHTFNPWIGCSRVSPGCDNCYAAVSTPARTMHVAWGATEARHRTGASNWATPKIWNGGHDAFFAKHGRRQRVFCASLADVFDNAVDPAWRRDLFDLIELTPNLNWLLLTKRIGNVFEMVARARSHDWLAGRDNVWLGATVVNQEEADRDIPKLLAVPARVRFLSMEPLLGPVSFEGIFASDDVRDGTNALEALDWVIVGGESGTDARPMHPDWARDIRDQCEQVGTPFFFKQWGEWVPMMGHTEGVSVKGPKFTNPDGTIMGRAGKKAAGRHLDGRKHEEFPA
ncbi:phage Gp37/Gp68 family protein [Paraburkholderia sp. D15]|uniref:phage Gp37/Gp68 family protein n=1 Tax=Paraburkholderia sp. D15 TaxID=2880218 RepID=UPI0024796134|nr:phage Gp37/Gp68 family protein [Paraburkholderia sp. D15]WGS53520.1 phage Gp37/Gp68 family protein [Paraburkholderia sp. D15]